MDNTQHTAAEPTADDEPNQASRRSPSSQTVDRNLLFALLAFESDLLDLPQLTAACRAWTADKSHSLSDLLLQRGWIQGQDHAFLEKQVERRLARHQDDTYVTLNATARGSVRDALQALNDTDINQSLSSWPADGPVLIETISEPGPADSQASSRYTCISEVGKGGLGRVWLARDNNLIREVALKEMLNHATSKHAVRMLIKEAQITGQLQHPNIVPVYEVSGGSRPFYTMKLVKGETLLCAIQKHHAARSPDGLPCSAERMTAESLSMQRLMSVFLNVCDALSYAHSRGIIHRDLKPHNIILGDYGEAIVLDWGLARKLDQKDDEALSVQITDEGQNDPTQAGAILGSPPYMSPEQVAGQIEFMDQRTDVYGLGAILFEILTGRPPHRKAGSEDRASLFHRIATGETPHVRAEDNSIPEELDSICAKAMAKTRSERFASAKDLKAALLEFQVHKESIDLAASAAADLEQSRRTNDYQAYSRAMFGFEEALRQWPANSRALVGLREARLTYAETAFQRGDYDLALSLLDQGGPTSADPDKSVVTLRTNIQAAAAERASRQTRIRGLRRFSIAASLAATAIASIAALWN